MKLKLFALVLLFGGIVFAGEQLIGEWLINEGSGTTAYCSPYSYAISDAELSGGENWVTDEDGTWFNFTGGQIFQASYTTFPIDLTKNFRITLDFWTGGNGGLLSNDTIGWGGGAWNIIKSDGKIVMQQHSGGVATSSINIGGSTDWHSLEVTYIASSGTVGFVVDGVEDTNISYYNNNPLYLFNSATRTNLVLGWHSINYMRLNGGLKNVSIYQNLDKPTSPSPYNGESGVVPGNITLSWDDSYGNYTAGYNVYISDVEDDIIYRGISPIAASVNSADVVVDGDTIYYWAVDGDASDPNSTIGDVWSFQTQGVTPYNLLPANSLTGRSIFANLSWTEDVEVDSFNVYISDSLSSLDNATPINTANTSINFKANALELHRWYYWKVAANVGGQEFDSVVSSFQTNGDEWLDTFSYGSNAAIRAAWVQQAGSGYDIAWISRPDAPYNNPALGNIPYGPNGASSFVRTFSEPLDFTTAANLTIRVFHEANSKQNSAPLTVSLLDELGDVIYEDTYTPGDVLSDDGTFKIKVWYRWIMPIYNVAGLDSVAAVKLTVPQMAVGQWLFIDDLTITVPQCSDGVSGDVYGDCQVDLLDFATIAANWLVCNRIPADTCDDYFFEVFEDME